MPNNALTLVFEISANPEQAAAALQEIQAKGIAASENLKSALNSIATSSEAGVQRVTAAMSATRDEFAGLSDTVRSTGASIESFGQFGDRAATSAAEGLNRVTAAGQAVRDVVPEMTGAFQEFGLQSAQSIKQMLPNLLTLRRLEFATLGLVSVGFYISEWQRVGEVIASAAKILGGYGEAEQEIMADAIKDNEKQIENYRQLNAAQLTQIGLIDDLHRRKVAELQFEIANAKISQSTFISQRESLQTQIDDDNLLIDAMQQMGFLTGAVAKAWVYYKEKVEGTGHALVKAEDNEKKAGLAILEMNRQLKDAEAAFDKATKKTHGYGRELDLVGVKIPPFIREIERLQTALQVPEAKVNNNIFAYAELNAKRLQEGLKPVEASFKELGIKLPKLKIDMAEALKVVGAPSPTGGLTLQQIIAGKYAVSEKELEANLKPAEEAMLQHAKNLRELHLALRDHGSFAGVNLNPLNLSLEQFNRNLAKAALLAGTTIPPVTQLQFTFMRFREILDITTRPIQNLQHELQKMNVTFDANNRHLTAAGQAALKAADHYAALGQQMAKNAAASQKLEQSNGKASKAEIENAAVTTAAMLLHGKALALFEGAFYAAKAVAAWPDYVAMAQYAVASAMFFKAAGEAGRASHQVAYGSGSGSRANSASGANTQQQGAYGPNNALAQGSRAPQYPQGGLTVAIMGNEEAGNWLATTLNKAVEQNGTRLISSHTQSSPPIGQ